MSVSIKLGATYLANGAADTRQSPANLRCPVRNVVQPSRPIRAAESKHFQRANTETAVSFQNTIEHADYDAAIEAITSTAAALPKEGTLLIENTGGTDRQMLNAKLVDHDHWHSGVTSYHSYTIVGGKLEDVPAP